MARAEVGDDVYGEDPTVLALEERVAGLFGHEAALFTPTGSMANVLAVGSLVAPGQEVLCESSAHIARAELGAHGAIGGITMRTWTHPRGRPDLPAIRSMFAPDMGPFFVRTAAISVENTHNFAGGAVLPLEELQELRAWASGVGAGVHLDGARIWNAHVATGVPLVEYGAIASVLSVCLSKGLGAPVGSLMVGSRDAIDQARVRRKRMGGGMRQVGILAAAGLHALDHHVERLAEDHAHARLLAEACGLDPATVDTNIVVVERSDAAAFVAAAAEQGVRVATVGPTAVRMVTHLDVSDEDAQAAATVLLEAQDSGVPRNDTSLIAVKSRAALPSPGGETVDELEHHPPGDDVRDVDHLQLAGLGELLTDLAPVVEDPDDGLDAAVAEVPVEGAALAVGRGLGVAVDQPDLVQLGRLAQREGELHAGAVAGRPPGGVGDAVEHVAGVVGDLVAVDVLVGLRGLRRLGRGAPGDVDAVRAAGPGFLGGLAAAGVVGGRVGAVVADQEPPAGRDQHQHQRGREDPEHRAAALLVVRRSRSRTARTPARPGSSAAGAAAGSVGRLRAGSEVVVVSGPYGVYPSTSSANSG